MVKKIVFIGCFFLSFLKVQAQHIELTGTVKDSLQRPLVFANVIAKPNNVNKSLQFAVTDNEGYYKLQLLKGDTLTISISYLGYKPVNYQFVALKNSIKNFVLQEEKNQLKEVVIELPVTVKEDTIIYNTKNFVNGTERKLKNVLKKLPGVAVDKNGGVTVNGKKVTNMLVEGKKFFNGGTKLAVDNIPANAVDKVEVIDNYNEVPFLKNLSDSNKMAMNIKLKEGKKNFAFGDVEAGKGNKNYYRAHANLFYYSPKTNVNFIGNLNNTGENTMTFKDYLSFQGGVNAVFNGTFDYKSADFSEFLNTLDILKSENKFAALNVTRAVNSKLDISGYAIFSRRKTTSFSETRNQYTSITEQKTNNTQAKNNFGIGKINIDYAPNNKEQWYFKTQVKRTENTNNNSIFSTVNTVTNSIQSNRNTDAVYANQIVEWHKQQSKKQTFSFVATFTYNKNNPTAFWQTNNPILQGLIPLDTNQQLYRLQQHKKVTKQDVTTIFKDFWVLNGNHHIYTTVGNNFTTQQFNTQDVQLLDDGTTTDFSAAGFNNQLHYKLNDFFVQLEYKFRTGIVTFKPAVSLHNYAWQVNQQNNISRNKWQALPTFLMEIKFNNSKRLNFNYQLKTNFSDADKLSNRFYLQSYNSVFKGNENLGNELYHSANIFYSRFSLYRGLMLNAIIHYTKKIKGVTQLLVLDETNPDPSQRANQFLTTQLIDNPSENWQLSGFVNKTINNLKYKLDASVMLSTYKQNINNQFQKNKSNNYQYKLGVETLFDNFPTLEIGFSQSLGKYTSSNTTTTFSTFAPYINIDYTFLKGVVFNFDYTKNSYKNKSLHTKNSYQMANATLSYKKENSAWSYKIQATNLFNAGFKQSNSFSDYLISDTKTYILPRVIMFSIGYNL